MLFIANTLPNKIYVNLSSPNTRASKKNLLEMQGQGNTPQTLVSSFTTRWGEGRFIVVLVENNTVTNDTSINSACHLLTTVNLPLPRPVPLC